MPLSQIEIVTKSTFIPKLNCTGREKGNFEGSKKDLVMDWCQRRRKKLCWEFEFRSLWYAPYRTYSNLCGISFGARFAKQICLQLLFPTQKIRLPPALGAFSMPKKSNWDGKFSAGRVFVCKIEGGGVGENFFSRRSFSDLASFKLVFVRHCYSPFLLLTPNRLSLSAFGGWGWKEEEEREIEMLSDTRKKVFFPLLFSARRRSRKQIFPEQEKPKKEERFDVRKKTFRVPFFASFPFPHPAAEKRQNKD